MHLLPFETEKWDVYALFIFSLLSINIDHIGRVSGRIVINMVKCHWLCLSNGIPLYYVRELQTRLLNYSTLCFREVWPVCHTSSLFL